jgi:hypothetical protein
MKKVIGGVCCASATAAPAASSDAVMPAATMRVIAILQ